MRSRRTRGRRSGRRTGPSRPRSPRRRRRGRAAPCSSSGTTRVLADQVRVEVAAGPAAGQRVVAGVDVVGADLVAADRVPGARQRGHQAGGDGRLALAGGRGGDDDAGERDHSGSPLDPALALLARVHRVLDLGHLGDQVGHLDQPRVGAAAGDHDVLPPRPVAQRLHHVVDVHPAPVDRVGELVEDVQVVPLLGQRPRLISAQPSAASAAWSSAVPSLRDHDQPEPILCHSTGPPSPVSSCSGRAARSAVCSPMRHFADFTNWKTPMSQPWFQARMARPNAAVDFPLPSPVWTISSGRLRRWRVVSPSSGTTSGLALRHRSSSRCRGGWLGERPARTPAVPLEVGHGLEVADRAEAQPGDRAHVLGDAEQVAQERLAVERHPAHAEALGGRGEPEVLDREHGGVEPRVRDGVAAEDVLAAAVLAVGDHDAHRGLADALDLDLVEGGAALGRQGRGEAVALGGDVVAEGTARRRVTHDDEVPGLAHARRSGAR